MKRWMKDLAIGLAFFVVLWAWIALPTFLGLDKAVL